MGCWYPWSLKASQKWDKKNTDVLGKQTALLQAMLKTKLRLVSFPWLLAMSVMASTANKAVEQRTALDLLTWQPPLLLRAYWHGWGQQGTWASAAVHSSNVLQNAIKHTISLLLVHNVYSLTAYRPPVMLNCFPKTNQWLEESHHGQMEIVITAGSEVR